MTPVFRQYCSTEDRQGRRRHAAAVARDAALAPSTPPHRRCKTPTIKGESPLFTSQADAIAH